MKQIVISVPDEWLEGAQPNLYDVMGAVMNGTVLPEHHGRLIDVDAYIDKHEECGWLDDITVNKFNKITPTIIPPTEEGAE